MLQEIFTRVWKQAYEFDEIRGRPFTWLVTLARDRALDRLRALDSRERAVLMAVHQPVMSMGRRGFGYVVALTMIVTLAGSAGMYAFENNLADGRGLNSYGEALWWTAMLLTSLGSEYWPQTAEGRVLCLLLSLYGFAMFGYVTATLATFFVGRDAEVEEA